MIVVERFIKIATASVILFITIHFVRKCVTNKK